MYTLEDIQAVDMEVANAITDEFERQNSHIELIASENWAAFLQINMRKVIRGKDITADVSVWML